MLSNLIQTALATHRVTRLVISDDITEPIRNKIFDKFPPRTSKIGYLLTCPWCVSIWAAAGLVLLDKTVPSAAKPLTTILAASSITGIIESSVV